MRDLVPPSFRNCAIRNGFSLVEVMVVLMIMGLLASAAVLSFPASDKHLRNEAERFAARIVAVRDEAIVGARPVALVVSERGYYFERRMDGQWQAMPGRGFDLTAWDEGTRAELARQRVVFDSLGLSSADAAIRLKRDSQSLVVHLHRDGRVSLDAS
ncbi:MAG: GspH/FimT family pseudopilin [Novosphingobium sp.]